MELSQGYVLIASYLLTCARVVLNKLADVSPLFPHLPFRFLGTSKETAMEKYIETVAKLHAKYA